MPGLGHGTARVPQAQEDSHVSEIEQSMEGGAGALPGFANSLAYMAAVM